MSTTDEPAGRLIESRGVRFVNGLFQARLNLPAPWAQVNLGLYPSEEAAAAARREVVRHLAADGHLDPLTVWRATRAAMRGGRVRADVLPKFVLAKGGQFYARTGRTFGNLLGPFPTAVRALLAAMDDRLAAARPKPTGG